MKRALIACDVPKATGFYRDFLKSYGFEKSDHTESGEEAKRLVADKDYDVCVIHAPLGHKGTINLVKDIARKGVCQVILFAKSEDAGALAEDARSYGVFVIERPISKQLFYNALLFADVANERVHQAQATIRRLEKRIREQETIARAKCILIEKKRISEDDAHKQIEKQAMDERLSRFEIAKEIIEFYG